jgi:xylulokinase
MTQQHFLGVDLSTQSLTALIICPVTGEILRYSLNFDSDLPHYETQGGVPPRKNVNEVLVNPLMWIEAMDRMLLWCRDQGVARNIAAVSIAAQQHGSVYLNRKALEQIQTLDPNAPPHDQLVNIFSRKGCPIWMDSSTNQECREITQMFGHKELLDLTGSAATERFAGPQIRKFWKHNPKSYENTSHIALISSFFTSLLMGNWAPLDCGDGLGMNLVDLKSRDWSTAAMNAAAPDLASRLPQLIDRDKILGTVSEYICHRYGFHQDCRVVTGTGDNPSSLAGLGLVGDEDIRAVSLGTSDTYFGYTSQIPVADRSSGHLFGTADGGLMFLLCFQNGSLARDAVRSRFDIDWNEFSNILLNTPPGNNGKLMLPYFTPEITPLVLEPGVHRFGGLEENDLVGNVRAVAEAQIMSMYVHSQWSGRRPSRILVTAGGSQNKGLLQLIAQVFGVEVQAFEVQDSAALGAAIRAAVVWEKGYALTEKLAAFSRKFSSAAPSVSITADEEDINIYQGDAGLIKVYEACEKSITGDVLEFERQHWLFMHHHAGIQ